MRDQILQYIEKRRIPLKTKHIATKFQMEPIDMTIILNQLAQQHLIKYQLADSRQFRVDWAGWVIFSERSYYLEAMFYDSLT